MTDGDALLAAIAAAPDEDTPRLAYADWLDEHGDRPRAEFVRVQCAAARDPGSVPLRARELTLLAGHGRAWLAPLRGPGGPLEHPATHGEFRRGFVEVVWMPAGWFVERAAGLFRRTPCRELRATDAAPAAVARLADSPFLARLDVLDLCDRRLGDTGAELLGGCGQLPALGGLRLRGCGLTDAGALRLAAVGGGWRPREVDVSHNPVTPAGLAALRARFGAAVRATPRSPAEGPRGA